METNSKRQVLPILIATLAIMVLATAPAMASSSKKSHSSAAAAASSLGSVPATPAAPKWGQHDSKPGPAWRTIGGTIKDVEGDVYTIEDFESKRVQMYVGRGTKYLKKKNVGDTVRAEITRGGFANSIQ
ncbi:MAG: hypothetical protein NT179_04830 [Nitrospirae bacterium]|nr:hypothetical protein [Nitrospirota bacterium]